MALMILPHNGRRVKLQQKGENSQIDPAVEKFQKQVQKLRGYLNKISKDNFEKLEKQILNEFDYNPSLLQELMKIIFMKSTTETSYLNTYIRLCQSLFRKFNDKDHVEMNFKKLLLSRCEKQFYKMLQREQAQRRERRASLEEAALKEELNAEFSK